MACDLKPHTWYTVEIRARPLTSRGIETGFWSEAVAHMELTKEDGKIWLNWNFVCLLTACIVERALLLVSLLTFFMFKSYL